MLKAILRLAACLGLVALGGSGAIVAGKDLKETWDNRKNEPASEALVDTTPTQSGKDSDNAN